MAEGTLEHITMVTKTMQVKMAQLEESNKELDHGKWFRAQVGWSFIEHSASPRA